MGQLVDEVLTWNTPLIGAYQVTRFAEGYREGHPNGEAPSALLAFVALAILTSKELCVPISNRRANLQSYALSFENDRKVDLLLGIQDRIKSRFKYTLDAIDTSISQGLIVLSSDDAKLYTTELAGKVLKSKKNAPLIIKDGDKAEILGKWFSEHEITTIASYFRLVF